MWVPSNIVICELREAAEGFVVKPIKMAGILYLFASYVISYLVIMLLSVFCIIPIFKTIIYQACHFIPVKISSFDHFQKLLF